MAEVSNMVPDETQAKPEGKPRGKPFRGYKRKAAVPFTSSADPSEKDAFEALVNAKVAERFSALEERLAEAAKSQSGNSDSSQFTKLLESLSLAFAEATTQGVGAQKPVPLEVLRAREAGHTRMVELIKQAKEDGEIPLYRLRSPVYIDEAFVQPTWVDPTTHVREPTDIDWPGPPNQAMIPMNEIAKRIYAAFNDSIGNMGRVAPVDELKGFNKGLNVKGPPKREVKSLGRLEYDAEAYQGLNIRHKSARGQGRLSHVLGTIAPPAEVSG